MQTEESDVNVRLGLQAAVAERPQDPLAWAALGGWHRAQGANAEAADCWARALACLVPGARPTEEAPLCFNLGNAWFDAGRWADAQAQFERAAQLDPALVAAAGLQAARCAVRRGELVAARAHFADSLRADPTQFSAWLEAGHVCRQQGLTDQMIRAYQRAADLAPDRWEAALSLARAWEDAQRWDDAAVACHRALEAADAQARQAAQPPGPTRFQVHSRLARWRLERGDAARALAALDAARSGCGEGEDGLNLQAELDIDTAEALVRLGQMAAAHRVMERASLATSEPTLARLAALSFRCNLWQEAQAVLRRCAALHPDSATARWNLAHSLAESWQMEEALATLAEAEALAPMPGARSLRASVAGRMGDADTALAIYRELAQEEGPRSKMASSAAMSTLYSDRLSPQQVADLHRQLFAPLGEGARSVASFQRDWRPDRRLRLGLVTADFHHQHPVNLFMQPVLARLDRRQWEVTVYFVGVSHDDQTHLARQRVDHWVECTPWTDAQLARRIDDDAVDILMDLAGHTSHQRMSMFAQRAAPVQVTFLGYPGSTGVPQMDWIVADAEVAPPEHARLYSEQVARLPHTVFCYAPEVEYPFPVYGAAHAERPLTFGSFNNVPKLTPRTLRLWAQVLAAVPGSRLLLKAPSFQDAGARLRFTQAFERLGVAADRLEFRGPTGLSEMMAEYADVDIALDPVPYNGGTTTLQALWMGVPVVVLRGEHFVSRMGASFMGAAGLPDWVAADEAAYVATAVRMVADRPGLLKLKQGLRQRLLARPGWDIDRYTRDFEHALRQMWVAAARHRADPSEVTGGR